MASIDKNGVPRGPGGGFFPANERGDRSARIACILVKDFPLAALIRANPELRDKAVAASDGRGIHAPLDYVSPAAHHAGIRPGMTAAQAVAILPELITLPRSPAAERSSADALLDVADSLSPIVEDGGPGRVFVDLTGIPPQILFSPEANSIHAQESNQIGTGGAAEIARRVRAVGMDAAVGIASNKEVAYLAARCGGMRVIPAGQEKDFLRWLPLDLLDLDPELELTLARWGIRRLGDLGRLSTREVGSRLGTAGVELVRLARGEYSAAPLNARPHAEVFTERIELDYGIDTIEPLGFVMRGLLDRLIARLRLRGLTGGDILLTLDLIDHRRDERRVTVTAATNEVRSLLALIILSLEKSPPPQAVESIRIAIEPRPPRAIQSDLFLPPSPAPERLQTTLARLAALCGPERVGTLHPQDSYRPEAVELKPFAPAPPSPDCTPPAPAQFNRMVVRAIRPAQEVEVMCERGVPQFVRGHSLCARVVSIAGPWRRQGEWWRRHSMPAVDTLAMLDSADSSVPASSNRSSIEQQSAPFARDYYDVALADGGVYRMFFDLLTMKWFVDGMYD